MCQSVLFRYFVTYIIYEYTLISIYLTHAYFFEKIFELNVQKILVAVIKLCF